MCVCVCGGVGLGLGNCSKYKVCEAYQTPSSRNPTLDTRNAGPLPQNVCLSGCGQHVGMDGRVGHTTVAWTVCLALTRFLRVVLLGIRTGPQISLSFHLAVSFLVFSVLRSRPCQGKSSCSHCLSFSGSGCALIWRPLSDAAVRADGRSPVLHLCCHTAGTLCAAG